MKFDADAFRVQEDEKVSLAKRPTRVDPVCASKAEYADELSRHAAKLNALQGRLYASGKNALLVILQGMDTSGKDGAIKHVMTGVNPQGCRVVSFKTPTHLESRHDFLWREVAELPERGAIGVFNRSYYEAVLITRVHPELLAAEGLETSSGKLDALFEERYHSIRALERHLTANGTRIVKIFLHISKDEQRRRLLQRLDSAEKAWKASRSDVEERKFWKDYQRAYEIALSETSRAASPWHVVPADDKPNARLFVSRIIIDALEALPLDMPPPDDARKRELGEIRAALEGS
jgi:PPK2 family polyphosphate:nucleotide phosphotransferase